MQKLNIYSGDSEIKRLVCKRNSCISKYFKAGENYTDQIRLSFREMVLEIIFFGQFTGAK